MRILLGLSGGVDSAYSVKKLQSEGHEVEGAVLKMHEYTEIDSAKACAAELGIKLNVIDCTERFFDIVIENFVKEYKSARTPNPCIICNSEIKFIYLYDYAMANGFDAISTGHYSDLVRSSGAGYLPYSVGDGIPEGEHVAVRASSDEKKDQSYMLWRVPEYVLRKTVFPLSSLKKSEVKERAVIENISVVERKESQEICFIRDIDYADYIERGWGKCRGGYFVTESGERIAEHKGIIRYTVGQRKGLGISAASRLFVTDINAKTGDVTLSPEDRLYKQVFLTDVKISLPHGYDIKAPLELSVKLRYTNRRSQATVRLKGDSRATVTLKSPQRAVTAGQSCVFYLGDVVVGGGFIEHGE